MPKSYLNIDYEDLLDFIKRDREAKLHKDSFYTDIWLRLITKKWIISSGNGSLMPELEEILKTLRDLDKNLPSTIY